MLFINITRWPTVLVFLLAGSAAVALAFISVNLVTQAMANVAFIGQHGWVAVQYGALWQALQLLVMGSVTLLCWMVFKICEQELEDRYFVWARARKANVTSTKAEENASAE